MYPFFNRVDLICKEVQVEPSYSIFKMFEAKTMSKIPRSDSIVFKGGKEKEKEEERSEERGVTSVLVTNFREMTKMVARNKDQDVLQVALTFISACVIFILLFYM